MNPTKKSDRVMSLLLPKSDASGQALDQILDRILAKFRAEYPTQKLSFRTKPAPDGALDVEVVYHPRDYELTDERLEAIRQEINKPL